MYSVGATLVFFVVSLTHWATLLYGRNLLAVGLVSGLAYATAIAAWFPVSAPGITLFFLGLFTGIGAYNLHRVAPKNRAASIRVSAGLFVALYAVLLALVAVPDSGFDPHTHPGYVAVGAALVVLAVLDVRRLERAKPDAGAFARESVFAEVSAAADADLDESPLVAAEEDDR